MVAIGFIRYRLYRDSLDCKGKGGCGEDWPRQVSEFPLSSKAARLLARSICSAAFSWHYCGIANAFCDCTLRQAAHAAQHARSHADERPGMAMCHMVYSAHGRPQVHSQCICFKRTSRARLALSHALRRACRASCPARVPTQSGALQRLHSRAKTMEMASNDLSHRLQRLRTWRGQRPASHKPRACRSRDGHFVPVAVAVVWCQLTRTPRRNVCRCHGQTSWPLQLALVLLRSVV